MSLKNGQVDLEEVPIPNCGKGKILIRNYCSLISAGTERMLIEFGSSSLIQKAKNNPDRLSEVFAKISNDGLLTTIESVKSKLDKPIEIGYSAVGIIEEVGLGVNDFKVGDRVVCNGPHAEYVICPKNLCAKVPDSVSDQEAVFSILSSIGLQGIRLAEPTFGETFGISGLGLIGLLTAQILISNGCKVVGFDPDPEKCKLAESLGIPALELNNINDPVEWSFRETNGIGLDGVLVTASTTSNEPLNLAAKCCRKRGRVILIGVTGIGLDRNLFYEKEIKFQVSCSYGPGRYDKNYEENGDDYPIGFVRWTEKRNFEAVLTAIKNKVIKTECLITEKFDFKNAKKAYEFLSSQSSSFGIILIYDVKKNNLSKEEKKIVNLNISNLITNLDQNGISFIGMGNYASRKLLPSFSKAGAKFVQIASNNGAEPIRLGKKYSFQKVTTDKENIFLDTSTDAIVIATRHDSHAQLIIKSLAASKHVFVEKPICLTNNELSNIKDELKSSGKILMVGFNRRFAPLTKIIRKQVSFLTGPKSFIYTCNAGYIPNDHWTQDPLIGGGRFLGEACHFVDLIRFLVDAPISSLTVTNASDDKLCPDTFSIQLKFKEGSIGTIHYFANGHKSFAKERLEIFSSGKIIQLDNFRKLKTWGIPGFNKVFNLTQDKGQNNCAKAFMQGIKNNFNPIPIEEIIEVQRFLLNANYD